MKIVKANKRIKKTRSGLKIKMTKVMQDNLATLDEQAMNLQKDFIDLKQKREMLIAGFLSNFNLKKNAQAAISEDKTSMIISYPSKKTEEEE